MRNENDYKDENLTGQDTTTTSVDAPISEETSNAADAVETTVFDAVHDSTSTIEDSVESESEAKPQSKRRTMIIAGSVVIALLAAGGVYAGVAVHESKQMDEAFAQAQAANTALGKSITTATPLAKTDKSKVADQKVLATLDTALKNAKNEQGVEEQSTTPAFVWQSVNAKNTYAQDADNADAARTALDKAVKLVNDSIAQKQLNDAKQALTDKINSAKQTLTDSDGKVQDNATRDQLSQAIDNAGKLLAGKQATVKTLQDEAGKLDNAINAVNQSMEAKRQADEEAARKAAEEEAARQAAAAQAQAQRSTGRSYSGTTQRRSGGYTAPQQNTSGNSGGSSSSGGFAGFIGGGEGVGSADDCDAACRAPIQH